MGQKALLPGSYVIYLHPSKGWIKGMVITFTTFFRGIHPNDYILHEATVLEGYALNMWMLWERDNDKVWRIVSDD
jgi:hypothetical protein